MKIFVLDGQKQTEIGKEQYEKEYEMRPSFVKERSQIELNYQQVPSALLNLKNIQKTIGRSSCQYQSPSKLYNLVMLRERREREIL